MAKSEKKGKLVFSTDFKKRLNGQNKPKPQSDDKA